MERLSPAYRDGDKKFSHVFFFKVFSQNAQARGGFSLPFGFDISAGADVVLCGQHELVVENPLGLMVQYGGRVQLDHLVVLHR